MTDTILTLAIIGAMLVGAGAVAWLLARAWWHYPVIALLTAGLFGPTARNVTGDIAPYLPETVFAHGKDNFILISIAATILVAVVAASVATRLADWLWRSVRGKARGDVPE